MTISNNPSTAGLGVNEAGGSEPTLAAASLNQLPTGEVTITVNQNHRLLTASNTLADADGMGTITYSWLRNGEDTGVVGQTYALSKLDVNSEILVKASYIDGSGNQVAVNSQSISTAVSVKGTAAQGQTLTAYNFWDESGDYTNYDWLRVTMDSTGGPPQTEFVGGGLTYTLTQADVNKFVYFRTGFTIYQPAPNGDAPNSTSYNVYSNNLGRVANVNDLPTGTVTITGLTNEGQTLSANNTLTDADGLGTITYKWLRDGLDLGVTGSTYTLAQADVNGKISVKASYIDAFGAAESVTSAQTAAVAPV